MSETNNPSFSELLDWLEGRLPPDQAQAVAARLESASAATQADLEWLRRFMQARRSVHLASPPPRVREALKDRFAAYAEARQPPGLFERLFAALTFDSRLQGAAAGIRSVAGEGTQHQMIYTSEAAEIALTVRPALPDDTFRVAGQIFPAGNIPADDFSIQLLRDVQEVGLLAADELGEFTFEDLPAGEYEMVVSAGPYEVIIPSFQLKS